MITEGRADAFNFRSHERLILKNIENAVESGVGLIQIREKALPSGLLVDLVKNAVRICAKSRVRLLVNDRFDVALAAGADGVQLTAKSIPITAVRVSCPDHFIVGVSTHSALEVAAAHEQHADFALFGPVFDSPAKRQYGDPKGTEKLTEVCRSVNGYPVLAVGGINESNIESVVACGAAGYAAIRLFNDRSLVNEHH